METIVIYPAPGFGHLISAVEFAKLLLHHSRNSKISITFLLSWFPTINTPLFTSFIAFVSSSFPSISFHTLPYIPLSKPTSEYPNREAILFDFGNNQGPDSQPSRSVVYLNFGSYGRFSKDQLMEIALGLERSMVRFLWVVREPNPPSLDAVKQFTPSHELDLEPLLPEGFLGRTKEKGIVVKSWAPQMEVLKNKSIGGFVTHCGWNSILEAVSFGVPMVAWPLYAEQRFNKIVLAEELKMALPMDESSDRFVGSDEVEKRIKQLVDSEEGNAVRKRVLNLKEKAKDALGEGGSSTESLAKLVESWKRD